MCIYLQKEVIKLQQDQFGRFLPTFIQIIELTEQEASDYWRIVSAVCEGKQIDSTIRSKLSGSGSGLKPSSGSVESRIINNKVELKNIVLRFHSILFSYTLLFFE